jgi:hypothetical protein
MRGGVAEGSGIMRTFGGTIAEIVGRTTNTVSRRGKRKRTDTRESAPGLWTNSVSYRVKLICRGQQEGLEAAEMTKRADDMHSQG